MELTDSRRATGTANICTQMVGGELADPRDQETLQPMAEQEQAAWPQ